MPPIESISCRVPPALSPIGTNWTGRVIRFVSRLVMSGASGGRVLRSVESVFDPSSDIWGAFHLREPLFEHELGHPGCSSDLRLENVGLARKQHALRAEVRADLVG